MYYYKWWVFVQLSSAQFCSKAKENKHLLFSIHSVRFYLLSPRNFFSFLCIGKICKHMFKCVHPEQNLHSFFVFISVNIHFDFSMSFLLLFFSPSFLSFQAVGCCRRSQAFSKCVPFSILLPPTTNQKIVIRYWG